MKIVNVWIALVCFIFLSLPLDVRAQVGAVTGFCEQGAVSSATSGLPSTNKLQGVIPQCLVTVYLTGTLNKATIYSNSSEGTLTNPFQATINGQWLFYAAFGAGYDVVMSGGYPPNQYVTPVTLTDIFANGSGGIIGPGTIPNVPVFNATNGITTANGVYAGYTGAGAGTSTGAEVYITTTNSTTSVSYPLASNPGSCSGGAMLFPDVRQFDEHVYELDSASSTNGGVLKLNSYSNNTYTQ
jgi:hypothetical protein